MWLDSIFFPYKLMIYGKDDYHLSIGFISGGWEEWFLLATEEQFHGVTCWGLNDLILFRNN
jgi:hypothetical protein